MIARMAKFDEQTEAPNLYWHVIRTERGVQLYRLYKDGDALEHQVHLVTPEASLRHKQHSPDGFEFGYGGSGPSQLALALLMDATRTEFALEHYQDFKRDYIAPRNHDAEGRVMQFTVTAGELLQWAGARLLPKDRRTEPCIACGEPAPAPMRCQNPACVVAAVEAR